MITVANDITEMMNPNSLNLNMISVYILVCFFARRLPASILTLNAGSLIFTKYISF